MSGTADGSLRSASLDFDSLERGAAAGDSGAGATAGSLRATWGEGELGVAAVDSGWVLGAGRRSGDGKRVREGGGETAVARREATAGRASSRVGRVTGLGAATTAGARAGAGGDGDEGPARLAACTGSAIGVGAGAAVGEAI